MPSPKSHFKTTCIKKRVYMQVGKYTMLEKVYSNMGVGGKADNS